jgi:hypothetical protein
MPQSIDSKPRSAFFAAALVLLLASFALAACGSSSSGSTSTSSGSTASTKASATTSTTTGGAPAARGSRFAAVRECLQKNGITLPKRTQGQRPSGGGFLAGGASQLPKGTTRAQYQAAIKKCGGFPGGGRFGGVASRVKNPAFKTALAKFAACLGENGVKVPAPNLSGKGPIFDTKGLNVSSAKFRAAETKCSGLLRSSFRPAPGAAGAGGAPGAAPPAGG